jgi:hypothetical protein
LISPIDLELDWRDLRKSGKNIALRGIHAGRRIGRSSRLQ